MPLLLRAEGTGWTLDIIGKLPDMPPFIDSTPLSAIVAEGAVSLSIYAQKNEKSTSKSLDDADSATRPALSGAPIPPLFFEAVSYDIHFETSLGSKIGLTLPAGAELRRKRAGNEHYAINFGNNVGFFDVLVATPDGAVKLRLEVFARKVDYRTDYLAMRTEISAILRNLAMTANAKTYGLAAPAKSYQPTLIEWFALLKSHFDELIKLTNAVASKPHSGLEARAVKKNTERARRLTRQTIDRALRRNNSGMVIPHLGVTMPRKIEERVSSITFDTPENRYYKGLLKATYRNMRTLSKIEESGDEDTERTSEKKFFHSIRPDLKAMELRLETAMRAPFLNTVGEGSLERPTSMVFHMHPTYSRVDKMARLLNGGLSFAGDIVPIGVKDTAVLYEYWCFLKIIDLLRGRFDLEEQSIVKTNRFKTTVTLAKGKLAAMRFVHTPTKKNLYVVYNRLFNRLPTIAQKPDNVIQLASDNKFYIFDAKYKIQFDKDYVKQYGGPGPMTEDINTMHRYRDAIAIPHPMKPKEYLKGVVMGAVVLFPFSDEAGYKDHKFYQSIPQVEIGGLPFLPQSTALMAKKLNDLLRAEYPEDVLPEIAKTDSAPYETQHQLPLQ